MTNKEFIEKCRRDMNTLSADLIDAELFAQALDRLEAAEKESEALLTLVKTAPVPAPQTSPKRLTLCKTCGNRWEAKPMELKCPRCGATEDLYEMPAPQTSAEMDRYKKALREIWMGQKVTMNNGTVTHDPYLASELSQIAASALAAFVDAEADKAPKTGGGDK